MEDAPCEGPSRTGFWRSHCEMRSPVVMKVQLVRTLVIKGRVCNSDLYRLIKLAIAALLTR